MTAQPETRSLHRKLTEITTVEAGPDGAGYVPALGNSDSASTAAVASNGAFPDASGRV